MKTKKIKWRDLQVGDQFTDGSFVEEIMPIANKRCIKLTLEGEESLIVSEDHMMKFNIYDIDGRYINEELEHSSYQRDVIDVDDSWVSAFDVFDCLNAGCSVISSNDKKIIEAVEFDDGNPNECFCIRTNTGEYPINGVTNHNCARVTFYGLSNVDVIDDCGGDHSHGISSCKAPGICCKCAKVSGMDVKEGQLIGSIVSTNLTEGLTQASLNSIHTGGRKENKEDWEIITDTIQGRRSPIIEQAREAQTAKEAREIICSGLKEHYDSAGIAIDEYNIEILAKQMTSYKNDHGEIRMIKDDSEKCDIMSMRKVGAHNNLFLQAELRNNYDRFVKPGTFRNEQNNAAIQMMM